MADLYKPYGGGFQFGPSNDIFLATSVELSRQRVVHLLLSGPLETDSSGETVRPADDPYNQDFGAGLGRAVDGPMDNFAQEQLESRIRAALYAEPTVDQTKPIDVQLGRDAEKGIHYVVINYTTLDGEAANVGFRL